MEDKLKSLGQKPTGLDAACLPNQDWLRNALLHLDPKDPYNLFKREKINEEDDIKLVVNERKYLNLL